MRAELDFTGGDETSSDPISGQKTNFLTEFYRPVQTVPYE
jgi:hypothetical protein